MPRNTRGGNKHKKGKNVVQNDNIKLELKEDGQVYGKITKKFGSKRIEAECSDNLKRSCIIRGGLYKKCWLNIGDIVLVDVADQEAIINRKYTPKEAGMLKAQGEISFEVVDNVVTDTSNVSIRDVAPQSFIPTLDNLDQEDSNDEYDIDDL